MIVSVESQKTYKYKSKYNKNISDRSETLSFSMKKSSISLFFLTYFTALLIFALLINFFNPFVHLRSPEFSSNVIRLPEEMDDEELGIRVLKASINLERIIPQSDNRKYQSEIYNSSVYTIQEDDRFSIIAEKFSIDLGSLLSVNMIKENNTPIIGESIIIPNMSGILYDVKKGDTLISIGENFTLDTDKISRTNGLISTVIYPGDSLFLQDVKMDPDKIEQIIGNKFIIPSSGRVKNSYGKYIDNLTGLKNYNYGIDIINVKGTAVYAAKDGVVQATSYNSYYGRTILVNHSASFQTMYNCLDSIAVKPGESVKRGELLGYLGDSGFKSSEHLRFSIFNNKEDVDPLDFIF